MTEIKLSSMNKTQLLNIMRQQEIEIQKLTAERDELLKNIEQIKEQRPAAEAKKASVALTGYTVDGIQLVPPIYMDLIEKVQTALNDMIRRYMFTELPPVSVTEIIEVPERSFEQIQ